MKKSWAMAAAGLLLGTVLSAPARAEEVEVTGCTRDGRTATLKVEAKGGIVDGPPTGEIAQTVFSQIAAAMSSESLNNFPGAIAIKTAMQDVEETHQMTEDYEFDFTGMPPNGGGPVIGPPGSCAPPSPSPSPAPAP